MSAGLYGSYRVTTAPLDVCCGDVCWHDVWLASNRSPSWSRTKRRTIASPSPVPPWQPAGGEGTDTGAQQLLRKTGAGVDSGEPLGAGHLAALGEQRLGRLTHLLLQALLAVAMFGLQRLEPQPQLVIAVEGGQRDLVDVVDDGRGAGR